jgi:predicted GIY-YIG superfamily endonuclease
MPRHPNTDYLCYLIYSVNTGKIYVGSTNNIHRRLRQHNDTKAGAKYTKKYRPWTLAAVVRGFKSQTESLRFEWAWQHPHRSKHLKPHREQGYISKYCNRCFSNWYKAAFYLCCVEYWRTKDIVLTGYYIPPLLLDQLTTQLIAPVNLLPT